VLHIWNSRNLEVLKILVMIFWKTFDLFNIKDQIQIPFPSSEEDSSIYRIKIIAVWWNELWWKNICSEFLNFAKYQFREKRKSFFLHLIDLSLDISNIYGDTVYPSLEVIKIDRRTPLAPHAANRRWQYLWFLSVFI
jgi:hypothetical protein